VEESPIFRPKMTLIGDAWPDVQIFSNSFKTISLGLPTSHGLGQNLSMGNFFPIVVFYLMGAIKGCYAPIGWNVSLSGPERPASRPRTEGSS
jgi:hypothetical protein